MSLLTEIQAAATDPTHSTADMLRKCQILAHRLRHDPFKEWVAHELTGYPTDESLPDYRGAIVGEVKADLLGFMGASAKNVGVPLTNLPEDYRERMAQFKFFQGVAMLEGIVADAARTGETRVMSPFSSELAALTPVWKNYQTISMWVEVPVASVTGILDQVRTRALAFTLEIETANPDAGEATPGGAPPVPVAQTDVIYNTVILGGNVAVGPSATVQVVQGDLGSLMAYLEAQGVAAEDRKALGAALEADKGLGSRVKGWLGEMAAKTVSVGGAVAEKASIGVITAAVLKFLGVG
jgi:hypothetical protein